MDDLNVVEVLNDHAVAAEQEDRTFLLQRHALFEVELTCAARRSVQRPAW